jgi:thiol:disulfide interchange protein
VILACLALGALLLVLRARAARSAGVPAAGAGVVVALLVLAVAITANFAGLYELPSLSITRGGGRASAFSTGLLARSSRRPCTRAVHGRRAGRGAAAAVVAGLLLFATLGFGLALPFLLLGFVPALRKMLPKPASGWTLPPRLACRWADRAGAAVAGWRLGGRCSPRCGAIALALPAA